MRTPPFLSCTAIFLQCAIPVLALPLTELPLISDCPFMVIWNSPTQRCKELGIPLDMTAFQAVTTPGDVPGQFLTLFYEKYLGFYPKNDPFDHRHQGGRIPQNGNLRKHLAKARKQIDHSIPGDTSAGLAVIDWESWNPLWDRNWSSKQIYKRLSIARARREFPFLSFKKILKLAKVEFEEAARRFMKKTLHLGISERPNRHWGFYLFPNCYNYDWEKPGYTGRCSAKTQKQNDQMLWLWEQSTALFPSAYLPLTQRNSPSAALFVRNRVQEAMRVAALPKRPYTMPVYLFTRPLYRNQTRVFYTEGDLVSSIGESAALGAAGVVVWGASEDFRHQKSCRSLSKYLTSTFNPYIANVTMAAALCSNFLCRGRGRCVRRNYNSPHYLHLNPSRFTIQRVGGKYALSGSPSADDLRAWVENFTCQCYTGRGACEVARPPPPPPPSSSPESDVRVQDVLPN